MYPHTNHFSFTNRIIGKLFFQCLAVIVVLASMSTARAALVPITPVVTLDSIINGSGSFQVGPLTFDQWSVVSSPLAPDPAGISVQGLSDGNTFVLDFFGGWSAGIGQILNSNISFRIVADPPFEVEQVDLALMSYGAIGDGLISIVENVFDSDSVTPSIAIEKPALSTFYQFDPVLGDSMGPELFWQLSDSALVGDLDLSSGFQFTPNPKSELFIQKDITVRDDTTFGMPGLAHLSSFRQAYTVIPEPGSLVLMGLGMGLMGLRTRRSV